MTAAVYVWIVNKSGAVVVVYTAVDLNKNIGFPPGVTTASQSVDMPCRRKSPGQHLRGRDCAALLMIFPASGDNACSLL